MSNQPEEMMFNDHRLLKGWMREKMENVRGPRCTGWPDLTAFYWRSEGDKLVSVGVWICVMYEAVSDVLLL